MRSKLILLSSLLFVTTVHAQSLDLNTALNEVIKDSPNLEGAQAAAEEAQWRKTEAWSGFLPRLRLGGTYLTDKKYQYININFGGSPAVIPQIVPTSQFNLMAELPLFDGFASTNRLNAAQEYSAAAGNKFDWEKFKTEMDVTVAFYQAIAAKVLREVAAQNLKALEDHEKDARLFRKSGVNTNYDVLRVEVQASNARTDFADADDEIIIAREKLAEVLGHEGENRELVGELPVPDEGILNKLQATPGDRADLRALRMQTAGRQYEEKASGRHWVPEFTLFSNYIMYNNLSQGLNDWDSYRNARQVGVMMTWNLFDGMASYSKAQQAILRRVQTEKQLRAGELAAKKDVSIWARRYRSQCRIYRARKDDVARSEESVRLAREGRRVGSRTDSDLLDAEADLYRARAGAVRAQLAAVEALAKLQLAEGRRYTEIR